VIRFLRRRGILVSRALIVGTGGSGIHLARHFQVTKHAGIQVAGFVDDFLPAGTPVGDGLRVLGPPSRLAQLIRETGASEVIVVPTAMAWESFQDLIRTVTGLNGHSVRLAPDFRDVLATSVRVHQFGFTPLLTIERVRITGLDAVLKVGVDYGLALLLLPVAVPLIAMLSALLAMTGIPPLTPVRALGRGGKLFRAFLLNTEGASAFARALRQTGADRLPLLFNVVLGHMSIVGPRLIPEACRQAYEPWLPNLLTVKPGITGPWFIRVPLPLDEEMQLNLFYIRNYTIWLDVEIVFHSLIRIMTGHPIQQHEPKAVSHERASVYR
ncbi:MAG: sugar transferase, partial [bacterium]